MWDHRKRSAPRDMDESDNQGLCELMQIRHSRGTSLTKAHKEKLDSAERTWRKERRTVQ